MSLDGAFGRILTRLERLESVAERRAGLEIAGSPLLRLYVTATSDIFSGSAIGATTTNVTADWAFTVSGLLSVLKYSVCGAANMSNPTVDAAGKIEMIIDSTTVFPVGQGAIQGANRFCNPFAGSGDAWQTGLSAGTHQIRVRLVTNTAGNTVYLRPASSAIEFLHFSVLEFQQG